MPLALPTTAPAGLGTGSSDSGILTHDRSLTTSPRSPVLSATAPAGLGVGSPILTRLVMGALFPFGLLITLVCGAELYTGNTAMVTAAVLEKKASAKVRACGLVWAPGWYPCQCKL